MHLRETDPNRQQLSTLYGYLNNPFTICRNEELKKKKNIKIIIRNMNAENNTQNFTL